jgi:hypothetical protein
VLNALFSNVLKVTVTDFSYKKEALHSKQQARGGMVKCALAKNVR